MAEELAYLAETYHHLPDTEMGACPGMSTGSAPDLFVEQVHAVWGQGNDKVAPLPMLRLTEG